MLLLYIQQKCYLHKIRIFFKGLKSKCRRHYRLTNLCVRCTAAAASRKIECLRRLGGFQWLVHTKFREQQSVV
jgi:hypothetical protein